MSVGHTGGLQIVIRWIKGTTRGDQSFRIIDTLFEAKYRIMHKHNSGQTTVSENSTNDLGNAEMTYLEKKSQATCN